jgi:hypothetical protein
LIEVRDLFGSFVQTPQAGVCTRRPLLPAIKSCLRGTHAGICGPLFDGKALCQAVGAVDYFALRFIEVICSISAGHNGNTENGAT